MPYVPYRNIYLFIHLFMSEITCSTVPSNKVIIVYDKDLIYLHILF